MAREGFIVYHELLSWLESYSDAERGRILTAMLTYSMSGEAPRLSGNERFIWPAIKEKLDRDKTAYEAACEKNRKNVNKRYERIPDATTVYDRIPEPTTVYDSVPNVPTITVTETITETVTETKRESTHAHGEYGWVKLTDKQYQQLLADLGQEELDRCIKYVDESAQSTGNRNKWKDWNLTVRKCHRDGWGRRSQTTATAGDLSDSYSMMERWANG